MMGDMWRYPFGTTSAVALLDGKLELVATATLDQ
jgi:hypothetical protein